MKFWKISALLAAVVLAGCGGSKDATIGGTISGLSVGSTVVLTNSSNGDVLSYAYNSSNNQFTFSKSVPSGNAYNVTVTTQPTGLVCSVANGVGTVNSSGDNVTNIQVSCVAGSSTLVPLQASVVGLASGAQLVLTDVSAGVLTITGTSATASGTVTFNFPISLAGGAVYSTTITTQPTGQTCTILNSSGAGTVPIASGTSTPSSPSPEAIACH